MRSWIRKNYSLDYFYTIYSMYNKTYKAYPIIYYSINTLDSVMDTDVNVLSDGYSGLQGMSYEKNGVGSLSGVVYKKIYNLPVNNIQAVSPSLESGDMGQTYAESLITTLEIPDIYGIQPLQSDVINMNYALDQSGYNLNKILYEVTDVKPAHFGNYLNVYQLSCRVANFTIDQIDTQLSSVWSFYEPTKTILPASNANLLNKMLQRCETVSTNLNSMFNNKANLYLNAVPVE